MLENECSEIDLEIAQKMAEKDNKTGEEDYQKYISSVKTMLSLEESIAKLSDEIKFLNDSIQIQVLRNPQHTDAIKKLYKTRLEELQNDINEKVNLKITHTLIKLYKIIYFFNPQLLFLFIKGNI